MASLDSLPPDQRAVLQLVLQRGRSYDQIAKLLSIEPASVRERAISAFDALGPQTSVAAQRRGLIADYLLGQLDPEAAGETRDGIADSPSERAWARVVASELASLAAEPLPEIPSTRSAPAASAAELPASPAPEFPASPAPVPGSIEPLIEFPKDTPDSPVEPAAPAAPAAPPAAPAGEEDSAGTTPGRSRRLGRRERKPKQPKAPALESKVPAVDDASGRRSSRLGGTVLIAITVLIVAVIAIVLLSSGSSNTSSPAAAASSTTPAAASATTAGSATASASGSGTTPAKVVAQISLTPTAKGSKTAGIAEVLKEGSANGIAIVAQNVTPNTTKPPNAYAVWLYNSSTDAHLLGFVNPGVGANGRLSTAGGLPTNAAHYKQLIVTLETKASPTTPGTIVLQGTLSGL